MGYVVAAIAVNSFQSLNGSFNNVALEIKCITLNERFLKERTMWSVNDGAVAGYQPWVSRKKTKSTVFPALLCKY